MLGTPSLDRGYSPTCFRSLVLGYSITIRGAFYNDKSKIKNIIFKKLSTREKYKEKSRCLSLALDINVFV
jgi:hypothetical protein